MPSSRKSNLACPELKSAVSKQAVMPDIPMPFGRTIRVAFWSNERQMPKDDPMLTNLIF
jgi:hypothetical protein